MRSVGPKIVTDGLILCLDPGNKKSYSGSGTVFYDLSKNNNGTLVNSPTFTTENKGEFTFNGSTNYISVDGFSNIMPWPVFTFCGWAKRQSSGQVNRAFCVTANTTSPVASISLSDSGAGFWSRGDANPQILLYTGTILDNVWYYICGVSVGFSDAKLYLNGEFGAEDTSTTRSSTLTVTRGTIGALRRSTTSYEEGTVACVQAYNRALSAAEIKQNYAATKSRFGY